MPDYPEEDFVPLTSNILADSLSQIEAVIGGGGFAFIHLNCCSKGLTNLGNKVHRYKHLRHVDMSQNKLKETTAVMCLPHLLTLNAEHNLIEAFGTHDIDLPVCQKLNLSHNSLRAVPPLSDLRQLRFARFSHNNIASLHGFGGHPTIELLDLTGNKITTLRGLGKLDNLEHLMLAHNALTSLEGLNVPSLVKLDLEGNQLQSLEHIGGAATCTEINLKDNKINIYNGEEASPDVPILPEVDRIGIELLSLRILQIAGNPFVDAFGDNARLEVILRVPAVKTVDGKIVMAEDRLVAQKLHAPESDQAESERSN